MSKIVSKVPTLPVRASDLHKGTFGTVRVVFRSAFMLGAAILCARGAAGDLEAQRLSMQGLCAEDLPLAIAEVLRADR
ncbi:hypothetical protein LBMAG49_25250 [Planctomycetota bacterium]|nr:hypothetical protein LBMAG49_25250 [Planctomycetota bacterium]